VSKGRVDLLREIKKQIRIRSAEPVGNHKYAQPALAHLSWLAWHCGRFAAVPSFLEAARSDIVAILYAGAIGMERSAYLHARSLLENLVRHCHYDARPALFAVRHFMREDDVQDMWKDLFPEIQRLPHFRPTRSKPDSSTSPDDEKASAVISELFPELKALYGKCSSFVHGSTVRYRSAYEGVGSITLDKTRTKDLEELLQQVGEVALLLLAMAHLGPYLLISQPIRRYMMLAMRKEARSRFLRCMGRVSLPWAKHQRSAALKTLHERKKGPVPSRHGLLLHEDGLLLVVTPETSR
jgi:hypothetical protein